MKMPVTEQMAAEIEGGRQPSEEGSGHVDHFDEAVPQHMSSGMNETIVAEEAPVDDCAIEQRGSISGSESPPRDDASGNEVDIDYNKNSPPYDSNNSNRANGRQDSPYSSHHARNPKKLYIGNLPPDATVDEVRREFRAFGKIISVESKGKFAFVEFENRCDAEEAINKMNDSRFLGGKIQVQPHNPILRSARGPPAHQVVKPSHRGGARPTGRDRRTEFKVLVSNLDERVSWQDLKDFGRNAGDVNFANVFTRDGQRLGIIEYFDSRTMERALDKLHKEKLYERRVYLSEDGGHFDSGSHAPHHESRLNSHGGLGGFNGYGAMKSRSRHYESHGRSRSRSLRRDDLRYGPPVDYGCERRGEYRDSRAEYRDSRDSGYRQEQAYHSDHHASHRGGYSPAAHGERYGGRMGQSSMDEGRYGRPMVYDRGYERAYDRGKYREERGLRH